MTIIASVHGRAARDGELRQSKAGKSWAKLSIAVEAGLDKETKESITMWIRLVAFGHQAETLAEVRKGETVAAIGRMEVNRWKAKDGETRDDLQLVCDSVLSARSSRPGGSRKAKAESQGTYDPAAQYEAANKIQGRADFDDELPF